MRESSSSPAAPDVLPSCLHSGLVYYSDCQESSQGMGSSRRCGADEALQGSTRNHLSGGTYMAQMKRIPWSSAHSTAAFPGYWIVLERIMRRAFPIPVPGPQESIYNNTC